jgi:hypothetical protein
MVAGSNGDIRSGIPFKEKIAFVSTTRGGVRIRRLFCPLNPAFVSHWRSEWQTKAVQFRREQRVEAVPDPRPGGPGSICGPPSADQPCTVPHSPQHHPFHSTVRKRQGSNPLD